MFPDGRVVRNDTFTPTSAALDISQDPPPPSACQCAEAPSATTFAVTSYTALATSQLTALTLGDATMDTAGLPALHTDVDVPGACVRASNGGHLAVRWDLIDGPDPTVFPTRIRSVQSPTQLLTALVYDWVPPGVQPTLTANTTFGLRTHMLLDSTPDGTTCVQMQSRLRAFVNTPALRFDAQLVAYGSTGVFLDQARTYDAPVRVTSSGGTIPTGFTIGIRFPGASAISTHAMPTGWSGNARATGCSSCSSVIRFSEARPSRSLPSADGRGPHSRGATRATVVSRAAIADWVYSSAHRGSLLARSTSSSSSLRYPSGSAPTALDARPRTIAHVKAPCIGESRNIIP